MTGITFKRTDPEECRIYQNGMIIGEVWRQDDILNPGSHYYVVHLSEDYRGAHRIHSRSRIRAETARLVDPHRATPGWISARRWSRSGSSGDRDRFLPDPAPLRPAAQELRLPPLMSRQ